MDSDVRRIATAVLNQAARDLEHSCAKVRADAAEFFENASPWAQIVSLHPHFVRRRMAMAMFKATASGFCTGSVSKQGRCMECHQEVERRAS
jgi:hypothetical protein